MLISKTLIRLLSVLLTIVYVGSPENVLSGESPSENWQTLETQYTVIHYLAPEDLDSFDRSVEYSPGQWVFPKIFGHSGSKDSRQRIERKVDALFEKVQLILDMRKRFRKVQIHIYENSKKLHAAYFRLYKKPCRLRAWYVYELNTVYLNADDVQEELLAHEMAHAIIDHNLLVRPPAATAEILAGYVHTHLYD